MKILITGASSGLGAEFARQYASKENELFVLARRKERLVALKKELQEKCKNITLLCVDVTAFEALQEQMKKLPDIDMVILNAGISIGHSNAVPTIAEFQRLYDVNVLANHAILEILLPKMRAKRSGKVVFISSLASVIAIPRSEVYGSSKRALNAYAEALRHEYRPYNVRIMLLLPGFIKSEMTQKNEFTMPFLLETKKGVVKMKKAIEKEKKYYAFPLPLVFMIKLLHLLPERLFQKLVLRS